MEGTVKNTKIQIIELLFTLPDEDVNDVLIEAVNAIQEGRKKRIEAHQRDKRNNEERLEHLSMAMRGEKVPVKMNAPVFNDRTVRETSEGIPGNMASRASYDTTQSM